MKKMIKFLLGIAMLPMVVALSLAFVQLLKEQAGTVATNRNATWFLGGVAAWLLLFALFPRPVRTYVLGHELTHALWGWMMGANVSRLRVSAKGGSVTLDKTNTLITLAPYFFPFYTVLALICFGLITIAWDTRAYMPFWYGVFGLTWSFHLAFTVVMLGIRQPDIHEHGRLFSYVLIYCVNLATAAFLLSFLTGKSLPAVGLVMWDHMQLAYLQTAAWIAPQWENARSHPFWKQ